MFSIPIKSASYFVNLAIGNEADDENISLQKYKEGLSVPLRLFGSRYTFAFAHPSRLFRMRLSSFAAALFVQLTTFTVGRCISRSPHYDPAKPYHTRHGETLKLPK